MGDATDLRFESDYFDVVHCHALLMHVPDPGAVLAEIKRVLKPGGTIACRELSAGSSFLAPDQGISDAVWSAFAALLAANGGHPEMGRDLKAVLNRAGFCDICPSASFDTSSTPAEIDSVFSFLSEWFLSKGVAAAASHGLLKKFQTDAWRPCSDGALGPTHSPVTHSAKPWPRNPRYHSPEVWITGDAALPANACVLDAVATIGPE